MMTKHTQKRRRAIGFTLIELLVTCVLMAFISTALVVLYRSATVEFEQSMTSISLGQAARVVAEKIVPYASTAVPISASALNFIYSPTAASLTTDSPLTIPNIYNLDFSTSCDLLNPANTGRFASIGSFNNARGTGAHYRYRIRFVPSGTNVGQLLLERVDSTGAVTGNLLSAMTSGGYSPRILGRNLYMVNFSRIGDSINVKIVVRTKLRDGRWLDGQVQRTTMGRSKEGDANGAAGPTRGREYTLFTTVLLPYYSGQ